ncbi:MAG: CARDB domain-containing protein, partial [Candidatus Poseidoniia archaeon]
DPHLVVEGWTSGSTAGLASFGSNILFAIGSELVNSTPITPGPFSISVPIGHALPSLNEALDIAVGARFQWSSNGAAETTVVHITSMSIVGGFHLEWDLSVTCSPLVNIEMDEDGGGLLIPMASRCEDDLTAWEDLQVFAFTEDSELIEVSALGGDIRIQPVTDASGDAAIIYGVVDASGNQWIDDVLVHISPVEDPPSISGLPVITYIELGQTRVIDVDISDPDTSNLLITTSRSWATIDDFGDLILTPVEPGVHMVEIIATDGTHTARQSIEVVVTAMPDLVLENLEVWLGGASVSVVNEGDVVQLKVYVRNEGRGVANGVDVRCWLDGVLVGSSMIDSISPGGLGIATCDTQFNSAGTALINAMVDGTDSIEEANEDNNEIGISIDVRSRNDGGGVGGIDRGPTILAAAIGIVVISFAALQMSPGRVSKPFRKMK